MIEINLLPPRLRVKKKQFLKIANLPFLPIVTGVTSFLVFIIIILAVLIRMEQANLKSLDRKISLISTQNSQSMDMERQLNEVSYQVRTIETLMNSRFLLAKKLNDLSDSVTYGIWFKSIDVKKGASKAEPADLRQVLVIEGSSVVLSDKEEGFIGKFVTSLKENKSFSEDFDEIELSKVERKKIKNTEIMDFVVICHFKKGRGL